jgi:DNA-directed RNA polymerase subunit RPC12/RpoP
MSSIQKFLMGVLPARWAAAMESESRSWKVRCPCGAETSVWDLGGIRWGAAGQPKRYLKCQKCGQATWHTLYRERPDATQGNAG